MSEKRVLILSHLWPGNPQSKNPLSGIYVRDCADEIKKRVDADVMVPLSVIPRIGEAARFGKEVFSTIGKRIAYIPDKAEALKYLSVGGKHADSVAMALGLLFRRRQKQAIVHCHTLFPDGMAGMIFSALTGGKFIVTVHGSEVMLIDSRPIDKILAREVLIKAKRVISVSELMREKILQLTDGKARVTVIRNGITELFPINEKEKYILFAGKLTKVKDPEILINAFTLFSKRMPEYRLLMAGDGELRKKIERMIYDEKLEGRAELLGYVDRNRMKELFSQASILAISSVSEGFPTVIFESFSSGTPIVSFDVGGVKEAVTDGENGYIVKERSSKAFAEALVKAACKDWDKEGMRKYAAEFTWEKISEEIVKLY